MTTKHHVPIMYDPTINSAYVPLTAKGDVPAEIETVIVTSRAKLLLYFDVTTGALAGIELTDAATDLSPQMLTRLEQS